MSMSLTMPSQYVTYPGKLEPIRAGVLEALGRDSQEGRKIQSCRYKSRCHSTLCPLCLRQRGYEMKDRIMQAASQVAGARLRFGTFVARDVSLDSLRETGRELMQAVGRVFKTLKVDGYAGRLEASFEEWRDEYHVHVHALIDSPSGGRGFIPRDAWRDEWLGSLPAHLHPVEGGAQVTPVRDLEATCNYLTKSPFSEHVRDHEKRVVEALLACKGMQRTIIRGSMAERGGVTHSVQSGKAA
jgi:hypothetical protein